MGIPWGISKSEHRVQLHEVGEYADYCCCGCDHDDEPEVELRFRPYVFSLSLEHADKDFVGHFVREVRVSGQGRLMWRVVGGGLLAGKLSSVKLMSGNLCNRFLSALLRAR